VGFADVLKACLFLPTTAAACQASLDLAESNIDNNLQLQAVSLLNGLQSRLSPGGAIVWTVYAKFFDESPQPCNHLDWCFTDTLLVGCPVTTVSLRQQMNRLVGRTNDVLLNTFTQWNGARTYQKVYPVEWSGFVIAMDAQFCESDSNNVYSDPSNDKLAFQRPNLGVTGDIDRRGEGIFRRGDNVTAVEEWRRDTSVDIPDAVARNFHPNLLGASIQAEANLGVIGNGWEDINGVAGDGACPI
jgi:hypothetical protein